MCLIFLSYASENTEDAKRILDLCIMNWTSAVKKVFFAPRSITPSVNWQREILSELRASDILLVLWSDKSKCSYGQLVEIGAAWALEKIILVIEMPGNVNSLPFILRDTQTIKWGEFVTKFGEFIDQRAEKEGG